METHTLFIDWKTQSKDCSLTKLINRFNIIPFKIPERFSGEMETKYSKI